MLNLEMVLIGALTGVLSGLLGVGGGLILVPLLNAAGFLMREAAAMSLVYVAFTAASGTVRHWRQGTIDPVLALPLLVGGTPLAWIGSHYAAVLPNSALELAFAFIVLGTATSYLVWGRDVSVPVREPSSDHASIYVLHRHRVAGDEVVRFRINTVWGMAVGACIGLVSGLLGVGGGWLLVPLLVLLVGVPLKKAIGTSLLGIIVPAATGAISHWRLGHLNLSASVVLVVAGIVGAQMGAALVIRTQRIWLERLLVGLLLIASIYMLGRGFGLM